MRKSIEQIILSELSADRIEFILQKKKAVDKLLDEKLHLTERLKRIQKTIDNILSIIGRKPAERPGRKPGRKPGPKPGPKPEKAIEKKGKPGRKPGKAIEKKAKPGRKPGRKPAAPTPAGKVKKGPRGAEISSAKEILKTAGGPLSLLTIRKQVSEKLGLTDAEQKRAASRLRNFLYRAKEVGVVGRGVFAWKKE